MKDNTETSSYREEKKAVSCSIHYTECIKVLSFNYSAKTRASVKPNSVHSHRDAPVQTAEERSTILRGSAFKIMSGECQDLMSAYLQSLLHITILIFLIPNKGHRAEYSRI